MPTPTSAVWIIDTSLAPSPASIVRHHIHRPIILFFFRLFRSQPIDSEINRPLLDHFFFSKEIRGSCGEEGGWIVSSLNFFRRFFFQFGCRNLSFNTEYVVARNRTGPSFDRSFIGISQRFRSHCRFEVDFDVRGFQRTSQGEIDWFFFHRVLRGLTDCLSSVSLPSHRFRGEMADSVFFFKDAVATNIRQ